MRLQLILLLSLFTAFTASADEDSLMLRRISNHIMLKGKCYDDLRVLCKDIGNRLTASPEAEKAVMWGKKTLEEAGADKVWLQPVSVPHWHRGNERLAFSFEQANGKMSTNMMEVKMTSLGNTVGTDGKILTAPVIMVEDFDEFAKLSRKEVEGKIVYFNYRFRQDLIHTFKGYSDAGPYRWKSPSIASRKGAVAVIIRSVSTGLDDAPHTGSLGYQEGVKTNTGGCSW